MLTIIGYKVRMNGEGEPFNALIVQGGLELVKSKVTGQYYATSKKASIPSTFDDKTCEKLVGHEIAGSIQKVECEPYEVTNQETGEVMEFSYRWVFVKEGSSVGESVRKELPQEEPELV